MRVNNIVLLHLFFLTHYVSAINILAIISLPFGSHYMAFKNLFHELAARGHSVTILNNFPDKNTQNLRYIDFESTLRGNFSGLEDYETIHPWRLLYKNINNHFVYGEPQVGSECEMLFTNAKVKSLLNEGVKYDVIFVEQFISDCALAFAGTHFDSPIIGITSHVLLPWTYPKLGIPFDVASNAFYFIPTSPKESLIAKIETALINTFMLMYGQPKILQEKVYKTFKKYMPNVTLDIDQIAKDKMKMVFAYQHYSITGARLLAPQLLEIAGVHITKPKPVAKEIDEFLSDAEHGAIYVSFGSNLKMSTMSSRRLQDFLDAFKLLPQKVLMKWELEEVPKGHSNVLFMKWFPQLDILCHPKVLAFVSHGGMLGTSEAAHCGKPILVIPFFGDQFTNAAAVTAVGLGKTLSYYGITTENLVKTIKELTSTEMQQSAQRVSRQWHDRPQHVLDSAVFWTEYVARHAFASAPPSLPSKYSSLFESFLIDIIIVLIIILLIPLWLIYIIFKLSRYLLCTVFGSACRAKEKRH